MLKLLKIIIILIIPICVNGKEKIDYSRLSYKKLKNRLDSASLKFGSPTFLRIFKEEGIIEVWLQKQEIWYFFKNYKICAVSGELGPKEKEGDKQAPEGVYFITQESFNPNSKYHLSIDIGYPNKFDKILKRTGGNIVIHGYCASIGCFAINNEGIEELYGLLLESIKNGQERIYVHVFPFKLTEDCLKSHMGLKEDREWVIFNRMVNSKGKKVKEKYKYDEFREFWLNLKMVYDYFEKFNKVPHVVANSEGYKITE